MWDSCFFTHIPAYCYYNNTTNTDTIKKFGALYNWYAVDTKKLAPDGWHVPTDSEWTVMEKFLILQGFGWRQTPTDTSTDYHRIAKSLAAKTDWKTFIRSFQFDGQSIGAIGLDGLAINNSSGFSALPSGVRYGGFYGIGLTTYYWCSTAEDTKSGAHSRYLIYLFNNLIRQSNRSNFGYSVRLVRDN